MACVVLLYTGFGACYSLYPDVGDVRGEALRAIPAGLPAHTVRDPDCEFAPNGCSLVVEFENRPETYVSDAELLRMGFRDRGWDELRFNVLPEAAGGTFQRGNSLVSFLFVSPATIEYCASPKPDRSPYLRRRGCQNSIFVGIPPRGFPFPWEW
jgi:hypothetical protein